MANCQIINLKDQPQWLPLLAGWHFDQWASYYPGQTLQDFERDLKASTCSDGIPQTFVAMVNGKPVGSASLLADDFEPRPNLTPWLASVYVDPSHRRQGIASQLIAAVEQHAAELAIAQLYLFTPDQQHLYRVSGWQDHEVVEHTGRRFSVMTKRLG